MSARRAPRMPRRHRSAGTGDPRRRPRQHDLCSPASRCVAALRPRVHAGAEGSDTGCVHGHQRILPDSPETLFSPGRGHGLIC